MNIALAKVGFASYATTAWFGRRVHSGATYAAEVKKVVGDGSGTIACCADNTGSNTSMQNGLFGVLSEQLKWFFIGCEASILPSSIRPSVIVLTNDLVTDAIMCRLAGVALLK